MPPPRGAPEPSPLCARRLRRTPPGSLRMFGRRPPFQLARQTSVGPGVAHSAPGRHRVVRPCSMTAQSPPGSGHPKCRAVLTRSPARPLGALEGVRPQADAARSRHRRAVRRGGWPSRSRGLAWWWLRAMAVAPTRRAQRPALVVRGAGGRVAGENRGGPPVSPTRGGQKIGRHPFLGLKMPQSGGLATGIYFRLIFAMALLDDSEAERIAHGLASTSHGPTLAGWIRALLDDRRARSALILRLSRELHHARRRLRQAARYLDGLLGNVQMVSREPWGGKLPCPHCGAPAIRVGTRSEPSQPGAHVLVHVHPDGKHCDSSATEYGSKPSRDHGLQSRSRPRRP